MFSFIQLCHFIAENIVHHHCKNTTQSGFFGIVVHSLLLTSHRPVGWLPLVGQVLEELHSTAKYRPLNVGKPHTKKLAHSNVSDIISIHDVQMLSYKHLKSP